MAHLAVLAANPGREIEAAELVSGANAFTEEIPAPDQLDSEAVRQYRNRLAELRGHTLTEPERAEHDWMAGELAAVHRPGRPHAPVLRIRANGPESPQGRPSDVF
jgi:hypothetical protein